MAIAHTPSWLPPNGGGWICQSSTPGLPEQGRRLYPAALLVLGTEQFPVNPDLSGQPSILSYVCARGAGRIDVVNSTSGAKDLYSPVVIPGVRFVGSACSQ